jgi:hypothetical protein
VATFRLPTVNVPFVVPTSMLALLALAAASVTAPLLFTKALPPFTTAKLFVLVCIAAPAIRALLNEVLPVPYSTTTELGKKFVGPPTIPCDTPTLPPCKMTGLAVPLANVI